MPADVDTARARTVVEDGNAALVAVPLGASGYCLIPALDGHGSLGSQCDYQVVQPEQGVDDRTVSLARPPSASSAPAWLLYGRITDPRATKVDLGPLTVELSTGGFFLKQVPENKWATLGGTANAGRVLDESGQTLRRGCVNWGPSPLSNEARSVAVTLFGEAPDGCKPQPIPSVPTLDLSRAEQLVEFTLVHDFSIWKAGTPVAMWSAPAADGSVCEWVARRLLRRPGCRTGFPAAPGSAGIHRSVPAMSNSILRQPRRQRRRRWFDHRRGWRRQRGREDRSRYSFRLDGSSARPRLVHRAASGKIARRRAAARRPLRARCLPRRRKHRRRAASKNSSGSRRRTEVLDLS